jgi:homoserine dehydrogenase
MRAGTIAADGHVRQISLIQFGVGLIGQAAILQVLEHRGRWRETLGVDVVYRGLIDSSGGVSCEDSDGYSEPTLRAAVELRLQGQKISDVATARNLTLRDPEEVVNRAAQFDQTILLDTAAGDALAGLSVRMLKHGGSAVFSNKAPLSMPRQSAPSEVLWSEARPNGHVRYETTCGAGLPVISTLQSLLEAGDRVIEITGALSGTLGAIFSDVAAGHDFSEAIRSAKERGYTEPDPRDDLSGLDVARKALILARTIGMEADLTDIEVESLVPEQLQSVSIDEFLEEVRVADSDIAERAAAAQQADATLKYVATVSPGKPLSVGIRTIPRSTVLGSLQGPENIISIRTERYDQYPLTISGPGAGAAVTAAGVVADLLMLAIQPGDA